MKGYQKKKSVQTMSLLVPAMSPPQQVQRLGRAGPAGGQPHEPLPWATPTWTHNPPPPPPGRGGGLCLPPLLGEPQPRPLLWVPLCLCTGNSSWALLLEPRGRAAQADPNGRLHE